MRGTRAGHEGLRMRASGCDRTDVADVAPVPSRENGRASLGVRGWPGVPRNQLLNDRVRSFAGVKRTIRRDACWYVCQRHHSHALPLPFIIQVKERLIFDNWPTKRAPELVVVELCFRSR